MDMPKSGGKFVGFGSEDREVGERMYQRRVVLMEGVINDLVERLGKMEKRTSVLEEENVQLRKKYESLTSKLKENEDSVKIQVENVKEIRDEHKEWNKEQEEVKISFRQILENQKKDKT